MTMLRFSAIARLSAVALLTAGLASMASMSAAASGKIKDVKGAKAVKGDVAHGQEIFNQCKVCHSLETGKNGVGPSLKGIVGTKAADVPGYSFSPAMKQSGLIWTPETLSIFLTAPMKKVPGTKMPFAGLANPKDREDVIAYLAKN